MGPFWECFDCGAVRSDWLVGPVLKGTASLALTLAPLAIRSSVRSLWSPIIKGGLVFGIASLMEITQLFGVPILGRTFDPLDFIMYAIGVTLAAILDTTVFPQIFEFWAPNSMDHP